MAGLIRNSAATPSTSRTGQRSLPESSPLSKVSDAGREPVRDWLLGLPAAERKTIGTDIKTVQFGWPLGMPLVRKMGVGLWEVRVRLDQRIARVLFTMVGQEMILLHGFIKKSAQTPADDLALAKARLKSVGA